MEMPIQRKRLAYGISDFEDVIGNNYYYVDKSIFIDEILRNGAKAKLIPRPRRFGKTLNMTMLKAFFETTSVSKRSLFDGLAITNYPDAMQHQGKYPVIWLTFKDIKEPSWELCYTAIRQLISKEIERHKELFESQGLTVYERQILDTMAHEQADTIKYQSALVYLSQCLHKHHDKRPIILIDEYDVPMHAAFTHGYYNECIQFMRGFLSGGLKDNAHLEFAVLTGILRVAKESIFSGLNNLLVCSVLGDLFVDAFGFNAQETQCMLAYYDLGDMAQTVRTWYDGYTFGTRTDIYNPWSVINFVHSHGRAAPHWINTSDNAIIKKLISKAPTYVQEDIEKLMHGNTIYKDISDDVTFGDLEQGDTAVMWSLFLASGYLTTRAVSTDKLSAELIIPNQELMHFYESTIRSWFREPRVRDYNALLNYLITATPESLSMFCSLFSTITYESFSYFDVGDATTPERFYHAFVLGLLVDLRADYNVTSNRESGTGRYDMMLKPRDATKPGFIGEFKKVVAGNDLMAAANEALAQIKTRSYATQLKSENIAPIIYLGFAFAGKESKVVFEIGA